MVLEDIKTEATGAFKTLSGAFTIQSVFRYLLEGLAIAIAAFVIPSRKTDPFAVLIAAVASALALLLLDLFSPKAGEAGRLGAGFSVGYNLIANPANKLPFM